MYQLLSTVDDNVVYVKKKAYVGKNEGLDILLSLVVKVFLLMVNDS